MTRSAAILTGGLGTRLRSVVDDIPKVLAPVAGKPFLSFLFEQLEVVGVNEVVLCTGYLGEKIEQRFGQAFGKMQLKYSHEEKPLGTGGGLINALPQIGSNEFLVLNGDSICDIDLEVYFAWHQKKNAKASIVLQELSDVSRYGSITLGSDERIQIFNEKSQSGPGLINAGIYLVQKDLLSTFPRGESLSIENDIFPIWTSDRILFGYKANVRRFIDIGTPESYKEAQKLLA